MVQLTDRCLYSQFIPTGNVIFGFSNLNNYRYEAPSQTGVLILFNRARLTFRSDASEWNKVNIGQAVLTGTGRLNGEAGYHFLIMVEDCQVSGCNKDMIRVKIWHQDDMGIQVIYDSQPDAADDALRNRDFGWCNPNQISHRLRHYWQLLGVSIGVLGRISTTHYCVWLLWV